MDRIRNYLKDEIVLIAPKRLSRPKDFSCKVVFENNDTTQCPFCKHNRELLEDIVYISDDENCLIVKNKYPAVASKHSSHEIIVDSFEHYTTFKDLEILKMESVIRGLISREKVLFQDKEVKCIQIFKNNGHYAGASLYHSHMQLLALEYVPDIINTISKNMTKAVVEKGECYICSLKEDKDIFTFFQTDTFIATTKADTLLSYTVDIIPKRHISNIYLLKDNEIKDFCIALKEVLFRINKLLPDFDYNIIFYDSPKNENNELNKDFHFFAQIVPRVSRYAGFEIATRNFINSIDPKEYADKLR